MLNSLNTASYRKPLDPWETGAWSYIVDGVNDLKYERVLLYERFAIHGPNGEQWGSLVGNEGDGFEPPQRKHFSFSFLFNFLNIYF